MTVSQKIYMKVFGITLVHLLLSFKVAFLKKELITSQKKSCNKTCWKKGCNKRFIKNWRPISLLNFDVKLVSKVLSNRIINLFSNLILNNQNVYVANRFISEGERLLSDILDILDILNMKGYLLTIDIEKVFDSVNHYFLLAILEKHGFKKNFLRWIENLFKNQESCIINGGMATHFFKLKKGTHQGNPVSATCLL